MTSHQARAALCETGSTRGNRPTYVVDWQTSTAAFGHRLLVATVEYRQASAKGRARKAAAVLGKIIEECLDDPFSRFVFWLTADSNIEKIRVDVETRRAIRAELARTVRLPTESQIRQMNMRINALPDYLREFFLEDYFDSLVRNTKEPRGTQAKHKL
ncbi:MAG TPA: hypothetical protein VEB88_06030 [Candidatus Acidoferrales bacterium]|nr:hypothetical protein [Candidatus Acidoferrales bacterium]